jgi:DNA-binding beta-propeller fold protein YncE
LDAYGGKVYVLNPEERQIYRYNKSGTSLSSPYAWVQDTAGLETAVDLAIDGNIYVLLSDGRAIQLLRGQATDFRLEAADPALAAPTKIATTPEGKYLYVLEPASRRLLAYDKEGQFLAQYYADKFTQLLDFAVDEAGKKAYVLNGTKLYTFGLTHLE